MLPTVPPSFTTASSGLSSWPPPGGLFAGYLGFLQAHGWGKPVWKESGQALLVRCTMAYSQQLGFGMQAGRAFLALPAADLSALNEVVWSRIDVVEKSLDALSGPAWHPDIPQSSGGFAFSGNRRAWLLISALPVRMKAGGETSIKLVLALPISMRLHAEIFRLAGRTGDLIDIRPHEGVETEPGLWQVGDAAFSLAVESVATPRRSGAS